MELVKFKEQINDTIALFDPEMSQQLGQNLFTYFLLNRVEVTDDEVIISVKNKGELKKINYNKGQFFAKMIDMAKQGFDLLAGDFTLTPFWDATFKQYSPSVVISYKKHLQILAAKGYMVNNYYLRKGDSFVEIKPYVHRFDLKPKVNLTKKIENGKAVNDILFYGIEIVKVATGKLVCSYVESTENIRARANFNNDMFHNSPNAQDTMYVKFVLNRAYDFLKNYGENSLPDIDKLEYYNSLAPMEAVTIPENTTTIKKLKKLEQNTKTWEIAKKRLEEQSATLEQIEANYEVDENDMMELRKIVSKNAASVKIETNEPEKMVFDEAKKEQEGDASNEI
jgi:uncharacterized protein (UPF0305 family)